MRLRRLAVVATASLVLQAGVTFTAQRGAQRHVLLIGVSVYPNLAKHQQLYGPVNDVALVRQILIDRMGVEAASISTLTGWPADPSARPTRANIEREFRRVADVARAGDQVMVLLAGHGSQQPDLDPPGRDEPDGLDEIFLPADAAGWDGRAAAVRNAISDDDLRAWITAIRNRGAFVWMVFDACQSNTLTRGSVERERWIAPEALVPADELARARQSARGAGQVERTVLGLTAEAGGIAALYAAQTNEATPEKELPRGGAVHGLFTYTLMQVLEQSASALTYRELALAVIDRYRGMDRIGPLPAFEGGGLDTIVLGSTEWPARSSLLLGDTSAAGLQVRAGALQGLEAGTILAVFPRAGAANPETPIGHVRVTSVQPTSAIVEPAAFGDLAAPSPAALRPGSRCQVVVYDMGDQVLRVGSADATAWPGTLDDALRNLSTLTQGLAVSAPLEGADWVLHLRDGHVVLSPASGWTLQPSRSGRDDYTQAPFVVGPSDAPHLGAALSETLRTISRARNLIRIASAPALAGTDVQLEIEMIRHPAAAGGGSNGVVDPGSDAAPTLRPGESVSFRVRNRGRTTVDVTLLHIDAHYQVQALFPQRDHESDNRLGAGAVYETPAFPVNDSSLGWEQVIAIGVLAKGPRVDFRALQQPALFTLPSSSRTRGSGRAPLPLERLLERAMYGVGTTRGLGRAELTDYAMRMLTWRTVPAASR